MNDLMRNQVYCCEENLLCKSKYKYLSADLFAKMMHSLFSQKCQEIRWFWVLPDLRKMFVWYANNQARNLKVSLKKTLNQVQMQNYLYISDSQKIVDRKTNKMKEVRGYIVNKMMFDCVLYCIYVMITCCSRI